MFSRRRVNPVRDTAQFTRRLTPDQYEAAAVNAEVAEALVKDANLVDLAAIAERLRDDTR
jgi:hypothetical protein